MELHPSAIGWLLRRTRLGLGLTLGQAALSSGLTILQVEGVERGVAEVPAHEVQLLLVTYQKEVRDRKPVLDGEVVRFSEGENVVPGQS